MASAISLLTPHSHDLASLSMPALQTRELDAPEIRYSHPNDVDPILIPPLPLTIY